MAVTYRAKGFADGDSRRRARDGIRKTGALQPVFKGYFRCGGVVHSHHNEGGLDPRGWILPRASVGVVRRGCATGAGAPVNTEIFRVFHLYVGIAKRLLGGKQGEHRGSIQHVATHARKMLTRIEINFRSQAWCGIFGKGAR